MTRPTLATEAEYQRQIIDLAAFTGWLVAHFRPGRTTASWRTPVEGDAAGFPDLVLVHPEAGFIWFVEVKRDDNRTLSPAQQTWATALLAAGGPACYETLFVPSGLETFLRKMQEARRTRLRSIWEAEAPCGS